MWPMPDEDPISQYDHIRPCPAEHEPQVPRCRARQQYALTMPVSSRRACRPLDEVGPRIADNHRDHQHQLEERVMKITSSFAIADPGPQDQQRNERGGRQARERDERLEECADRPMRPSRSERHREDRRQHKSANDAPDVTDVLDEPLATNRRCLRTIVSGSARNVFDTKPPNVAAPTRRRTPRRTKGRARSGRRGDRLSGSSGGATFNGCVGSAQRSGRAAHASGPCRSGCGAVHRRSRDRSAASCPAARSPTRAAA